MARKAFPVSLVHTPFGFSSTALDVIDGIDLSGRRAVVTGASSGTGVAATSAVLATSPLLDGIGGRYFIDCDETETVHARSGTLAGVAGYALDPDNAARLWDVSETLVAQSTSSPAGVQ
ncbi:hypothetical protein A5695_14945 [Mycobacterium sp. E1747]|nr:hypothetical protein A5695_14945 [Mycobacterium sp. E1747]